MYVIIYLYGQKRRRQKKTKLLSFCWLCCCFFAAAAALKKTDRRGDKKAKLLHKKKRRKQRVKRIIMSADELKQKGNEAFKQNDFKLACELFTEAIGLDSTNHVLYSNRSAARVILVTYFLCIQLYTFSKRFSIVFICLRRLFFLRKE